MPMQPAILSRRTIIGVPALDDAVQGIIKTFGARPDFLCQVVNFSHTIHFSEGHLTRRHKEMIASYVSYLNRCPY